MAVVGPRCPFCEAKGLDGKTGLFPDSHVYHGRSYGGKVWLCLTAGCDARVGAHKDTWEPLGIPANAETWWARRRAHAAFDPLWKGETARMARSEAYQYLQLLMGLPPDEAHIARFTIEQCEQLIEKLKGDDDVEAEVPDAAGHAPATAQGRDRSEAIG